MPANLKTVEKALTILIEEIGELATRRIIRRLARETVPSGNASYDETIRRLQVGAQGRV